MTRDEIDAIMHKAAEKNHPCFHGHNTINLFLNIKHMTGRRVRAQWWSRLPGSTLFYTSKPCASEEEAKGLAFAWIERQNRPCGSAHSPRFLDTTKGIQQ